MVEKGKKYKIIFFVLCFMTIILSVITLIFSFFQIPNNETYVLTGGCGSTGPYEAKQISTNISVECGWNFSRSFVRIALQFIIMIFVGLLMFMFYQKRKYQFLFFSLFLFFVGIVGGYSFIDDATAIKNSYLVCNSDLVYFVNPDGKTADEDDKDCILGKYYGTLAFNILTTCSVFVVSIIGFLKRGLILDDTSLTLFSNSNEEHGGGYKNQKDESQSSI